MPIFAQILAMRNLAQSARRFTLNTSIPWGAYVQLRSGSIVMTVVDFEGPDVVCGWYDEDGAHEARLSPVSLQVIKRGRLE